MPAQSSGPPDQRWSAYSRPALGEGLKHGAFEHDSGSFAGLPPLSQAFSTYPQYPRYVDSAYVGQSHGTGRGAPYGGEVHGYFALNRANEDVFSAPHYMSPPQTGAPPLPALPPVAGTGYPAAVETRLPMNGQGQRAPTYSAVGPIIPDPLSTQHFWSNYTVHGHTVAERQAGNGFRAASPVGMASQAPATLPPAAPMTYKAPAKVKQIYSFVPLPGAQTQKRPRRRYDEIERIYQCGWNGCEKAYGTLNHLNAHVFMQGHGEKRTPDEFKEIRAQWRAKKKEEGKKKQAEEQEEQKQRAATPPLREPRAAESQTHTASMGQVVYTPLPNMYPYGGNQQAPQAEQAQHAYSMQTYHASILPHLNQYTAQPQAYASSREYKPHTEEEDRDAEGEPDPETSG